MTKLPPFLLFDGNCAAAMTFYQSCLGGNLILTKVEDSPMKDQMPTGGFSTTSERCRSVATVISQTNTVSTGSSRARRSPKASSPR